MCQRLDYKELSDLLKNKSNPKEFDIILNWIQKQRNITLNQQQLKIFENFYNFANSNKPGIFVLNGHAGTGKTTLISFFLDYIGYLNHTNYISDEGVYLLTPTGKAARNLQSKINHTHFTAQTIHSLIYQYFVTEKIRFNKNLKTQKETPDDLDINEFVRKNDKLSSPTFIIVDEASMLADNPIRSNADSEYRKHINCSGFTLRDLLQFFAKESKIILVGDDKQLPPIELIESLAFKTDYLKKYQPNVINQEIILVERYKSLALVETVKTLVKHIKEKNQPNTTALELLLKVHDSTFKDDSIYKYIDNLQESIETYVDLFKQKKEVIGITYRNDQAKELNNLIRIRLNKKLSTVDDDDVLIVNQNNYFYNLFNGDLFSVKKVHKEEKIHLRTFLNGQYQLVDVSTFIVSANLHENFKSPIQKYYKDIEKPVQVVFNHKVIIGNKEVDIKTLIKHDFFIRYFKLVNAIRKKSRIAATNENTIRENIGSLFQDQIQTAEDIEKFKENNINEEELVKQKDVDGKFIQEIFSNIFDEEKLEKIELNTLRTYLSVLLKIDKILNVLMVDYGYVITCHKAQGSEWENVMIMEYPMYMDIKGLRWLYTAITRTSKNLYFCNIPKLEHQLSINQVKPIVSITARDSRILENIQYITSDENYYYLTDITQTQYRISQENATILNQLDNLKFPMDIVIHKGKIVNIIH